EAVAALELAPAKQEAESEGLHLREDTEARHAELPERQRLEESSGAGAPHELAPRYAEHVLVRDHVQWDVGRQARERRPPDHGHVVAGALPLAGQVRGVD